jgi:DNA processing protein
MAAAMRLGVRFVAMGEPDYPKTLKAVDTAPPLIGVRGSTEVLSRPCVAMVGSRNASASGLTFTERLSRQLGEAGYVVVSGLARGIDTRAHRATLSTGTVAVLAGGHDKIYPSENEPLLRAIIENGGAIVSEMPMGWEPRGRDFPRRNRIVSGLSYGVVVVEAARRSGSLITARFALEQGREVFAVPGSPLDPRAEGTNDLIRDGANLCAEINHVTSVLEPLIATGSRLDVSAEEPQRLVGTEELWDELDLPDVPRAPKGTFMPDSGFPEEAGEGDADLIQLLGPSPISIDDLVRQSGLSIRSVQMTLLELEIAGRLERHGGNAVSLIAGR